MGGSVAVRVVVVMYTMRRWELDQSQVVWQSVVVVMYTMRRWELDQSQVAWQSEWWW